MDFNTYVIALITFFGAIFPGMIFTLATGKKTISEKDKYRTIFASIIIYIAIVLILTVLYKNITFNDFKNFFNSFIICKDYIKDNILKHWYNFFLLWINVDVAMSIFDSKILIGIWASLTILIVLFLLLLILSLSMDLFPIIDLSDFLELCFSVLIPLMIASIIPMSNFFWINVLYIACGYSIKSMFILMLSVTIFLAFLFFFIHKIKSASDLTLDDQKKLKKEEHLKSNQKIRHVDVYRRSK